LQRPASRAPQLLDPRDKTASHGGYRWAVVPARWPTSPTQSRQLSERPVSETKIYEPSQQASDIQPSRAARYDDRGWKSAAGF
jgi:hypothetical protein